MANSDFLPMNGGPGGYTNGFGAPVNNEPSLVFIRNLILELGNPDRRENALRELSQTSNRLIGEASPQKRAIFDEMGLMLWNSFGTVAILLQEIVSIYPDLSSLTLKLEKSNRVCNALALLQCLASNPDTQTLFLNAHLNLYLYPFLTTNFNTRSFEFLRITSLGVIGALVKFDDTAVIKFLISTELFPICLHTMRTGSELSKTVATFIAHKILLDDMGLGYVCTTPDRFFAVCQVFTDMVASLDEFPSPRLLKHIIRCYLRLTDHQRGREVLRRTGLPDLFTDDTLTNYFDDDPATRMFLQELLQIVDGGNMRRRNSSVVDFEHILPN